MHAFTHTDVHTDILRRLKQTFAPIFITYTTVGLHTKHMFTHSQFADIHKSKLYMHNINS